MTAAPGPLQAGALIELRLPGRGRVHQRRRHKARPQCPGLVRAASAGHVRRPGRGGWAAPLARRLDAPVDVRGVAVWLALATAAPVDAAYIAACHAEWGYRLADLEPRLAAWVRRDRHPARVLGPAI